MNHLFIDPGVNHTGYCILHDSELAIFGEFKPDSNGLDRIPNLANKVSKTAFSCGIKTTTIEKPELWSTSHKSFTSATRGDLLLLSYLVGAFIYVIRHRYPFSEVELLSARQWKGNLPKNVVHKRVYKRWSFLEKDTNISEHTLDALGMALSHLQGWK